ncbi:MAG TPA: methyltransferase domain-containing protein [Acidobacteriota bacterium]|jgi:SAM-dependent methyltransferase|nr:methyltransferase domain-containing protein [Acidobacteriota bacterium]
MISPRLLAIARCPSCRTELYAADERLTCRACDRRYAAVGGDYLDLRPATPFAEMTKYVDEAMYEEGRHDRVSPPLLSAAIRNDMLRQFLQVTPDDRVIDLGCGSGRALVWNRDSGANLAGIDVSPHFAVEALASVDLMVGDLRQLPVADRSFTKAFTLDVLEHLSRDALMQMLKETARVLEPGGHLFVYTHVRKNSPVAAGLRVINRLARGLERVGLVDLTYERLRKSDHVNPLADIPDLERVVEEAGFRIERIRYYTPLVGGFVENILLRMAERWATRRAESAADDAAPVPRAAVRAAHQRAQARLAKRGFTYGMLVALTWLMKIDLVLFGRIRSGPFFALLTRTA